ncbi:MAG TPA: PIG-L family deacetylase [Spirochaetia bacterium]|nr:PIG-L family deacetylase [Spirochaetia bacterium]
MAAAVEGHPDSERVQNALIVVAHPDDETLWAGGLILSHPRWYVSVASLCRGSDADRAPKFRRACSALKATGCRIADTDDGPEQNPLSIESIEETILGLYPAEHWDRVLTHSLHGEYTRHRRHEEVARAVVDLWARGRLCADELWMFAYEDEGRRKLPEAIPGADLVVPLTDQIYRKKLEIITELYGFDTESWEARATPRVEAFWRFSEPQKVAQRFPGGNEDEDSRPL